MFVFLQSAHKVRVQMFACSGNYKRLVIRFRLGLNTCQSRHLWGYGDLGNGQCGGICIKFLAVGIKQTRMFESVAKRSTVEILCTQFSSSTQRSSRLLIPPEENPGSACCILQAYQLHIAKPLSRRRHKQSKVERARVNLRIRTILHLLLIIRNKSSEQSILCQ